MFGLPNGRGPAPRPKRFLCAGLLLAGLLAAGLVPAGPSWAQEGEEAGEEAAPARILRSLSLADVGFPQGVTLQGPAAQRRLFFPLPRGTRIEAGRLDLRIDHGVAVSEVANLRVALDGVPRRVERLSGDGGLEMLFELEAGPLSAETLPFALEFAAALTDDRCYDERVVADFAVLRPDSALHLAVDARSVEELRSAWLLLPRRVTISIGNEPLAREEFAALLEVSRRILASGRELRFIPLPDIPETAPVGVLASGLAGARSLLFEGYAADEAFAIGQIVVASAEELQTLERSVAEAQERFRRFSGAPEGELPQPDTRFLPEDGSAPPLRLVRFLDYPVIALGGTDPEATAALLAGDWSALADGPVLDAAAARPGALRPRSAGAVTFAELGFDNGPRMSGEQAEWQLDFRLGDLPTGRLPTAVELQLTVAPGAEESRGSPRLHLYLNDALIGSLRPGDQGRRREETVALPTYLLGIDNRLRLALQRPPAEAGCLLPAGSAPAQVLGGSRILAEAETTRPRDFLELASQLGEAPLFLLPETLLQRPERVMPLLARLGATLLPRDARPRFRFFGDGPLPPIDGPFLLLGGVPQDPPLAPLTLEEGRALLLDRQGRTLLDATAPRRAAVLQLARLGDHSGLWVQPDAEGRYPAPATLFLGREDVAVVDSGGVAVALQSDPEAAGRLLDPWRDTWRALLDRHRYALAAGLALFFALLLIALRPRRRR